MLCPALRIFHAVTPSFEAHPDTIQLVAPGRIHMHTNSSKLLFNDLFHLCQWGPVSEYIKTKGRTPISLGGSWVLNCRQANSSLR